MNNPMDPRAVLAPKATRSGAEDRVPPPPAANSASAPVLFEYVAELHRELGTARFLKAVATELRRDALVRDEAGDTHGCARIEAVAELVALHGRAEVVVNAVRPWLGDRWANDYGANLAQWLDSASDPEGPEAQASMARRFLLHRVEHRGMPELSDDDVEHCAAAAVRAWRMSG